jgi:hypothetical protein
VPRPSGRGSPAGIAGRGLEAGRAMRMVSQRPHHSVVVRYGLHRSACLRPSKLARPPGPEQGAARLAGTIACHAWGISGA